MRRLALAVWVALAMAGAGCASFTLLSAEDRLRLQRDLTSGPASERYLRASSYLTPFFGDASKRLLTPYPPEEVRLLNDTQGKPINPGPVQAMRPAGTRVRLLKVEFPTTWVVAERILYTPRTQPWVYLEVEGAPAGPPVVLVLPPRSQSREEFLAELDRHLVEHDPAPRLAKLQERFQEAIREKKVIEYMPAVAVEMSWGYPERIQRSLEGQVVLEEWSYPGGKRKVFLSDGQVTRVEEGTPPSAAR